MVVWRSLAESGRLFFALFQTLKSKKKVWQTKKKSGEKSGEKKKSGRLQKSGEKSGECWITSKKLRGPEKNNLGAMHPPP